MKDFFYILMIIAGIALVTVLIIGCDSNTDVDVDEVKRTYMGQIIHDFSQYDLGKHSERMACLKMLQKNAMVMEYSGFYEYDKVHAMIFESLLETIREFRDESELQSQ